MSRHFHWNVIDSWRGCGNQSGEGDDTTLSEHSYEMWSKQDESSPSYESVRVDKQNLLSHAFDGCWTKILKDLKPSWSM